MNLSPIGGKISKIKGILSWVYHGWILVLAGFVTWIYAYLIVSRGQKGTRLKFGTYAEK